MLAQRLGEIGPSDAAERADLYYVCLMGWVGCIADSKQSAAWFGDDISYRAGVYNQDMKPLPFLGHLLGRAGAGQGLPVRAAKAAYVLGTGASAVQNSLRLHCQVSALIARRLGLPEMVCLALGQVFARWDGKGMPKGMHGADIERTIRLWQIADVATAHAA